MELSPTNFVNNAFDAKEESNKSTMNECTSDKKDSVNSQADNIYRHNDMNGYMNGRILLTDDDKDAQEHPKTTTPNVHQIYVTSGSQSTSQNVLENLDDSSQEIDSDVFLKLCGSRSLLKRSLSQWDRPNCRRKQDGHCVNSVTDGARKNDIFSNHSNGSPKAVYGDEWRLSLDEFTSKRQGAKRKEKDVSKEMRTFYKNQDNVIDQCQEIRVDVDDAVVEPDERRKLIKKASIYAKITFFINFCLLGIKVVAVVLSGSISLISSLVDSCVDLVSGSVIWATSRAIKKTDRYMYPQGRTKLEPIAIVILAVIMAFASVQIIKESFTKIAGLAGGSSSPPNINWITIGISGTTIVVKLTLFLFCRRVPATTVQALALDHRNDVMSNSIAILFGYLGSQEMQDKVHAPGLVYLDPIGAIIISVYIIINWCRACWDQIKLLVGHTAANDFISKITWICMDHHKLILKVDTVKAFHFGNNFLVEVDIVLPEAMTVKEAHDIAEPLQQKIEALSEVERAFVHIDYETTHNPADEHKIT